MQITIPRDELLKPVSLVAGVVERRQTLPILSFIKVRQAGGRLTLTGTDLEIEMSADVAVGDGEAEFTVPARKLFDICRALPEGSSITLAKQGERILLKAGKSRFTLQTLAAKDFPVIDTTAWELALTAKQVVLKTLFERTQFCMAQQDVRYYLNGLCLEFGTTVTRAVATDGHRMAISETDAASAIGARQIVVPRKGIHEMARLLDMSDEVVEVQLAPNHLRLRTNGGVIFTTKLIDGRFPDYTKVVPASLSKTVGLDRMVFREALGRVAILSNEKYRGVRLNLDSGTLSVSAHNPEQEEAVEEMDADYRGEGLEIGFNVNYLMEAVNAVTSDRIQLGLNDANSSCVLWAPNDDTTRYIIMPMRL
ncbi:MAG: DNA polymerase III subunit beta [Gammaproteobacteria bacterium]